MTEALPAEVAARAGLMTVRFARRTGHGPVAEILSAAAALDHQLGALVGRLDAYRDLSEALSYSSRSMLSCGPAARRSGNGRPRRIGPDLRQSQGAVHRGPGHGRPVP